MGDLTPEQQLAQYAAIELLYSEGKWSEVLQAGEALLAVLPTQQGHPLRPKLELVMGHTLLYGLANPDGAAARYRAVPVETKEPVLREIATQGLLRCDEQRQLMAGNQASEPGAQVAALPWERSTAETPGAGSGQWATPGAAMPWLAELGIEPGATTAEPPVEPAPRSSPVRTVRNLESTDGQPLIAETPKQEPSAQDEPPPEPELSSAEQTLAQLREPDVPTPEEVAELARGLLEVVLP